MKKAVLLVLFSTFMLGAALAQQVLVNGKPVAEVKVNGDLMINGSLIGLFDKNGDVYRKGERIGQIRTNGEFWLNGSKAGRFEYDGSVYSRANAKLGKVETSGDVYEGEKKIAVGKGIKREWLVGMFFFYFKADLIK